MTLRDVLNQFLTPEHRGRDREPAPDNPTTELGDAVTSLLLALGGSLVESDRVNKAAAVRALTESVEQGTRTVTGLRSALDDWASQEPTWGGQS